MRGRRRRTALLAALALAAGCGLLAGPPSHGGTAEPPAWKGPPPPPPHALALPADRVAALLTKASFRLEDVEAAPGGVMGAKRAVAVFPVASERLEVKWKQAPAATADGWNNTPRKELAAQAIQAWFLDAGDYIVPPSAARCIPLTDYRSIDPGATPTIAGTRCVLGLLAAWLHDVRPPDPLYDRDRFLGDAGYAYHMADFNVLTFLIEHRDGRSSNFLVADDPTGRRVFSVDNGIAFGGLVYNYFVENWDVLRVPAVRRAAVARLRRIRRKDLDALAVVAELRAGPDGVLRATRPGSPAAPDAGVFAADGRVQLGLSRNEITQVAERLHALLARVDAGELPLF